MSNTVLFDTRYSHIYQEILHKVAVASVVSTARLKENLSFGQTVTRYALDFSGVRVRDEVRTQTDRTADDIGESTETLTINKEKYLGVHIHDWDKLQKGPMNIQAVCAKETAIKMKEYYDGDVLNEVENANDTLDDGDIGGTDGSPINLSITNLAKLVTLGRAKLRGAKVAERNMVWIIDPTMTAIIEQYLMNKETGMADNTFKNNYVGMLVNKIKVYESNSLTYKNQLNIATNPTDGDTISFTQNGTTVTLTFKDTASAANQVKIGDTAALTLDNLVHALNGTGTSDGTNYFALDTDDREFLRDEIRVTATDGTTYVGIECVGSGRVTVASDLTDGTDSWGTGYIETYFGVGNSIDVVRQQDVKPDLTRPAYRPRLALLWVDMLWGQKTFTDSSKKFLNCKIQA